MAHLEVTGVSKRFTTPGGRDIQALDDVSFSLKKGDVLCIVGPNGSGKTTLFNCINGTAPRDQGGITLDGRTLEAFSGRTVAVFQDVNLGVVPSMTALENLAFTFSGRKGFCLSIPSRKYLREVEAFLEKAGLLERFGAFLDTPAAELSGGQRQQLAVAMAVRQRPELLLLDEFVASLDPRAKGEILSWTRRQIRESGITTLMVTHDHDIADRWGDFVMELDAGRVVGMRKAKHDVGGGKEAANA